MGTGLDHALEIYRSIGYNRFFEMIKRGVLKNASGTWPLGRVLGEGERDGVSLLLTSPDSITALSLVGSPSA